MLKKNVEAKQVILTGFMGTGKSVVGELLASAMKRDFIDTDKLVEKNTGLSVPEIFKRYGETYFRDRESEAVESLKQYPRGSLVVSTGGGIVLREKNREILQDIGMVILLTASPDEIVRRTGETADRPLLSGDHPNQKVASLLEEREEHYRHCEVRIDTTGLAPLQVARKIMGYLRER
ncbi:MAG: shikimate kinase [Bacillota bacterium]